MALNEDELEILEDLRESHTWAFLWSTVLPSWLEKRATEVAEAVRKGDIQNAMYALGRRDGALDVAESVYTEAKKTIPEHLRNLRRSI